MIISITITFYGNVGPGSIAADTMQKYKTIFNLQEKCFPIGIGQKEADGRVYIKYFCYQKKITHFLLYGFHNQEKTYLCGR